MNKLTVILLLYSAFTTISFLIIVHKFKKNNNKLFKYLHNYLNAITSARYGNLNLKIQDGYSAFTKELEKNTNALFESITDRDNMIQEYIKKDKERQNLKQDYISSLTHDLKVPIIAQNNTYDLLLKGTFGQLNEKQTLAIQNLKISNNDLRKLILNLLDAQKLESNSLTLNKEEVNIVSLIKEIIKQDENIFTIQNKKIIFDFKGDIFCGIDKFLIKRVLNNLISNAIFYSKESDTIKIELNQNKDNVEIKVIDEGKGIDEEDIKKIFEKYYTSSKKYSSTSTGLGLYIANKIITAHKGKITAKNNETKGATFAIYLPI